jgi:hypothetical protein
LNKKRPQNACRKKDRSEPHVYRFLVIFGAPWEPPGVYFGALLGLLGASWSHLGRFVVLLGALGLLLASLGDFLEQFGLIFGHFWHILHYFL